ncbi:hypothetical protein KSP40_PGU017409 [Platanthera guangdongensis]|uniref:Protein Abitram n=1 Tax=Platanthera guangdongensis TaxID=2320717 RepID=A0ABR2MDN5_9ASPA
MDIGEGPETLEKPVENRAVEEELRSLLVPDLKDLPSTPRTAVESNFVRYYAVDFLKPGHDQYIYCHANGLCVIGIAPTHRALSEEKGVSSIDFNVGKSDRSEIKVTGKRKRNAQHLHPDSALCNVCANGSFYIVRCCVKGSLLEVNNRLIKHPDLLNFSKLREIAEVEGYVALGLGIPSGSLRVADGGLNREKYCSLRII